MKKYESASYQQDVMEEMARQADVFFYGPGFNNYDKKDFIDDVLAKAPFNPDTIFLGHAWFNDLDGNEIDPHPKLQLEKTTVKKVIILNKEYTNLDSKLNYIKKGRFDLCFTHHHDINRYSDITGIECIFWPFAFDHKVFNYNQEEKLFDVGYSGMLQNQNKNANQSDLRARIMRHFFISLLDVPIKKRRAYKDMEIFWNSIARNKTGQYLSRLMNKRKNIKRNDYAIILKETKIYINTLSPVGLISPRFFECMSSGTLVFCEESELYKNIFSDEMYVTFKSDLSDFDEKLLHYLLNKDKRKKIAEKAQDLVRNMHTWEKRISELLISVERFSLGK